MPSMEPKHSLPQYVLFHPLLIKIKIKCTKLHKRPDMFRHSKHTIFREHIEQWTLSCSVFSVQCGRCIGLTTLPPSCADCLEIWSLNLLEPSGPYLYLLHRVRISGSIPRHAHMLSCRAKEQLYQGQFPGV
jgi:hypothetical protein